MPARFETFERDLKLATASIAPTAINAELAQFAKAELAKAIATGEGNANYDRYVNGSAGAAEETVQAPGPILYVFNWWKDVIVAALEQLQQLSPRASGRFASSFIVLVNQSVVTTYDGIPGDAEILITNFQPYVRKVEVGAMKMNVPARVFDRARTMLSRRFGNSYRIESRFLDVRAGVHPGMPYLLKGEYSRLRAARIANPSRFAGRSFPKSKDMEVGQPITYPALIINSL